MSGRQRGRKSLAEPVLGDGQRPRADQLSDRNAVPGGGLLDQFPLGIREADRVRTARAGPVSPGTASPCGLFFSSRTAARCPKRATSCPEHGPDGRVPTENRERRATPSMAVCDPARDVCRQSRDCDPVSESRPGHAIEARERAFDATHCVIRGNTCSDARAYIAGSLHDKRSPAAAGVRERRVCSRAYTRSGMRPASRVAESAGGVGHARARVTAAASCVRCENQSRGTRSGRTNQGFKRRGMGAGGPGGREPPRRLSGGECRGN